MAPDLLGTGVCLFFCSLRAGEWEEGGISPQCLSRMGAGGVEVTPALVQTANRVSGPVREGQGF